MAHQTQFPPLVLNGLDEKLRQMATKELHESDDKIKDGLMNLKERIKEDEMTTCKEDDFLLMFLRNKKFDVPRAFAQMQRYSYNRHSLMDYYGFLHTDRVMPAIRDGICGLLPRRDAQGRVICYFRPSVFCSKEHDPDDVLRSLQALSHFALSFPATQVAGFFFVVDASIKSLDVLHLLFKYIRFSIPTVNDLPARFKGIELFNTNVVFWSLMSLVIPICPGKLVQRINLHGDKNTLIKTFDPSLLPEELGGTLGPLSGTLKEWLPEFEEYLPKLQASNIFFKRKNTIPFPENGKICADEIVLE